MVLSPVIYVELQILKAEKTMIDRPSIEQLIAKDSWKVDHPGVFNQFENRVNSVGAVDCKST